jgi:glutamyl-Q tRNA(Asp) synthetase
MSRPDNAQPAKTRADASIVTRFAPSPTGLLHLGHAYAALFAERAARQAGGRFLLRIEDIDRGRARDHFETAILDDLAWLGLEWEEPVRRQSEHFDDYRAALVKLSGMGVVYPCFCTRAEIRAEIERAGTAPHLGSNGPNPVGPDAVGPDGPLYPGTCRALTGEERDGRVDSGEQHALRLDTGRAAGLAGPLVWRDLASGETAARPEIFGDVVIARKDTPASYHLAVTVDDHLQGVSLVTRGDDLFAASHLHRLLQALLSLDVPDYRHHRLITDADGKRFAKRDRGVTLQALRQAGESPQEVRRLAGFEG